MPNPDPNFYTNNTVNVTDLDTEYPVPGQDNDSQGFRDNFTVIDENFNSVKTRLEDLETNTVRLDADNSFSQSSSELISITKAHLISPLLSKNTIGSQSGANVEIVWSEGDYQTISLAGDTTLNITDVPAISGVYQKIMLEVTSSVNSNLEWDDDLTIKFDTAGNTFWASGTSVIDQNDGPHVIELWTHDGGNVFYAKYIGQFA